MIWEQKITNIVMLTKLVESLRLKADQYIPEEGPAKYGDIEVEMISRDQAHEQYVLTKLKLKKGNEIREVFHYQYTGWLDHMAPHPDAILSLMFKVKDSNQVRPNNQQPQPQLVHCSAGIGRTGTWIAIQYMIDLLTIAFEETKKIKIKKKYQQLI